MLFVRLILLLSFPSMVAAQIEVASIKPSKPGAVVQDARMSFPPGRIEAANMTLTEMVNALNGYNGRVEGGPKWAQTDRYDIVAKTSAVVPPAQLGKIFFSLLEDRFKLTIHQEPREVSGLALTVGKKSPNLPAAKEGEETKISADMHKAAFQSVPMSAFSNYLRQILHTTVIDRTGLTGKFNFSLDLDAAGDQLSAESTPPATRSTFADRVQRAVEQLGFRLEATKVSLPMTVIDHAERPGEN
jgi:uncharacterized protein (TIGR03435 family)